MTRPVTASATFSATLIDEWISSGLTHAYIAPGSRSTPLALALSDRSEIRLEVFHDERSASFAALGHGLASSRPAVILCSSGTAATHFHGAVVEADLSCVPLLVCTADRPPELVGVGAPQTIEQTKLYGPIVRLFAEPGCPEDSKPESWRPLAGRAWAKATGSDGSPGPVHLNLAFRDPLDGLPGPLPPPIDAPTDTVQGNGDATVRVRPQSSHENSISDSGRESLYTFQVEVQEPHEALAGHLSGASGMIIAGAGLSDSSSVAALAKSLAWPLVVDQRSGLSSSPGACVYGDLIARSDPEAPDVIIRFGEQHASRALNQWVAQSGSLVIAATPYGRIIDPDRVATIHLGERGLADGLLGRNIAAEPGPTKTWSDRGVSSIVDEHTAAHPGSELAIARGLTQSLAADTNLVLSSSMPIRQVEWFGGPTEATVCSNRGANGIDGVIATAIGVAATAGPTVCLIGDVAVLHDSTSLIGLARRSLDLTILVIDNDGGGIFSHLPQGSSLDPNQFEQLFGTPHGTDIAALARANGIPVETHSEAKASGSIAAPEGIRLVLARTDRAESLQLQRALAERIVAHLKSGE